jgi:hypothetical protein
MRDKHNIKIRVGETFKQVFKIVDNSDVPFDLTGATIVSQCRDKQTNILKFTFVSTIDIPATSGIFMLSLTDDNTAILSPQDLLKYDIKITFATGETVSWIRGDLQILERVSI